MKNRRDFLKNSGLLGGGMILGRLPLLRFLDFGHLEGPFRPDHPDWPVGWATYNVVKSLETDIKDLLNHGVGLIGLNADNAEQARGLLEIARKMGMKYCISFKDMTEEANLIDEMGIKPSRAQMIGGAYLGKAIDRHLFSFSAEEHQIIIEPPIYDKGFPYRRGMTFWAAGEKTGEPIGHYYPDMGGPVKAEVIVPIKPYDGKQHLKIIPARITKAPVGTNPKVDSITPDLAHSNEIVNRTLYQISFDLSGLDDAMLDMVGLAVYWEYKGTEQYMIFKHGHVSAGAESTHEAVRRYIRNFLAPWIKANDGVFPHDVVIASRYGDECFYITGHLNDPAVSYPLWDYSPPGIAEFYKQAGQIEYPRTWGFPEIYGSDAYGWWLYNLHNQCAKLVSVVKEELALLAPDLLLFRNTTRDDVFNLSNDHDGSGQDLLAQQLDIIHLDPYPVNKQGYNQSRIPIDMSYCAGLARRHNRILVPWLQAHTYGGPNGLQTVSPDDVRKMCEQHLEQGVDALMWLGYGKTFTFPNKRPDSWEQAGKCLLKFRHSPPPKPKATVAVLRPYRVWALSSDWEGKRRNPADWMLQQWLWVWAVKYGQPYNVFELPPEVVPERKKQLKAEVASYQYVVSTASFSRKDTWVLGSDTVGKIIDPTIVNIRFQFEEEMKTRGWLS